MSAIKDGGPAFPATVREEVMFPEGIRTQEYHQPGMSLRDWLAGQALASYLTATHHLDTCAKAAYELADAMLRAREGK